MRNRNMRLPALLVTLALTAALLGGCTYRSGPKSLAPEEPPTVKTVSDAGEMLTAAVKKSSRDAHKFSYQGWISSRIQKRKINSMYSIQTFDQDRGFLVGGSVLQKQYRYYRWEDRAYVSEGDMWRRLGKNETRPDPFGGFRRLTAVADRMRELPEEKIMNQPCQVLQVELAGADITKIIPPGITLPEGETARSELARAKLQYTIWIGKADHYIYQSKARLIMPIPGAGALIQDTYFKFWNFNDPGVNLTKPENVERYLAKEE